MRRYVYNPSMTKFHTISFKVHEVPSWNWELEKIIYMPAM
jgi:hypothetical protein